MTIDEYIREHLSESVRNMWPTDEPLWRKLVLVFLNLLHIIILLFISVGWLLIPPRCKELQLFYILTVLTMIGLFIFFNNCILTIIKKKLYTGQTCGGDGNINLVPLSKPMIYLSWIILLFIGIFNYIYPSSSAFCLAGKYFTCRSK